MYQKFGRWLGRINIKDSRVGSMELQAGDEEKLLR